MKSVERKMALQEVQDPVIDALWDVKPSTFFKKRGVMDSVKGLAEVKGELNLDNKCQSDDLFYIIMNEIHHRFNQFCVILKLS